MNYAKFVVFTSPLVIKKQSHKLLVRLISTVVALRYVRVDWENNGLL